ncbi:MAG: YeeE/YedE family protein [Gammaproteobacteria bacterium]|nr:YeeE/YedE family protein [Gammaproteobacteria bacterium]
MLALLALSLFLQAAISSRQALIFLTGAGLGISLLHGMFGFTGGWRRMIRERNSVGVRGQLLLLMLSAGLFIPLIGGLVEGVNVHSSLGEVGVSLLVGAFLFGIGMQLGGGCGSGTLFTVGQGQVDMLLTLAFFITGVTLATSHLDWWLALPNIGAVSLIRDLGWLPALSLSLSALALLYVLVTIMDKRRHGQLASLQTQPRQGTLLQQLVFGPWPLWWAVLGLAGFGLAALLLTGYPWSITFAFGVWGAKLFEAVGGDASGWAYWASGYPARALSNSVLADATSVMNFGIMLGALLAASLASKFAPVGKLSGKRVLTAVVGGLLLGYGARLAFGCNIGALLGGIASGSLHGWIWLPAAFLGGILGVRIRIWMKLDKPV